MTGDAKALLELQITVSRMGMYNNYFLQRGKNHHNSKQTKKKPHKKNPTKKNPTQQTHTLTFQVLTASASRPASTVLKTQGEFFGFCLGFSPPHHYKHLASLKVLNSSVNPSILYIGQLLCMPLWILKTSPIFCVTVLKLFSPPQRPISFYIVAVLKFQNRPLIPAIQF